MFPGRIDCLYQIFYQSPFTVEQYWEIILNLNRTERTIFSFEPCIIFELCCRDCHLQMYKGYQSTFPWELRSADSGSYIWPNISIVGPVNNCTKMWSNLVKFSRFSLNFVGFWKVGTNTNYISITCRIIWNRPCH